MIITKVVAILLLNKAGVLPRKDTALPNKDMVLPHKAMVTLNRAMVLPRRAMGLLKAMEVTGATVLPLKGTGATGLPKVTDTVGRSKRCTDSRRNQEEEVWAWVVWR